MPTTKNNKQNIEFQIKGIEILDFELKHPQVKIPATPIFHFNINIQHKINPENKLVFVIVGVNILHEDKKTLLGNIKVSCIFNVVNFEEFADNKSNNSVLFPKETIEVFNSISISTTRGVMFTCFRGTFLHNAVLPVVDPKGFKQENITKK